MKDKTNEKEIAKLKQIIKIRKKKKRRKKKKQTKKTNKKQNSNNNNNNNNKTKLENYMIKNPLVTLLYMEKHAVYFEFLKRFIDIPFVKTVRRTSLYILSSLTLLMCRHCLLK